MACAHRHAGGRVENAEVGVDGPAVALELVDHEAEQQRRVAGGALDHVLRELHRALVVILVRRAELALLEEPASVIAHWHSGGGGAKLGARVERGLVLRLVALVADEARAHRQEHEAHVHPARTRRTERNEFGALE